MTIVDTSVWIDFLEGGNHWTKEHLKELIKKRESIAYTDLILLEILQGVRTREKRESIETKFNHFIQLSQRRSGILLASEIYQELLRKGISIRSIIDCLIAAIAIESGAKILHKDRDFEFIAKHYPILTISQQ